MSGSRRRSTSSGSRFQPLPQDADEDYDDDSDSSAEEMKLSQEFYPTAIETVPKSVSRSSSSSSAGEMKLSQEFYPQGGVPIYASSSQGQRVSSRLYEIQPLKTEEPTGLDFQWGHFGRVPNFEDDVAVEALDDLFGQGEDTSERHTSLDIEEDLRLLNDIGLNIDYTNGLLGEGMYGAVYKGYYGQNVAGGLVSNNPFAVKIVDFGDSTVADISTKRESFETEKYILTNVSHRNVVTIRMIINMGEIRSFPFADNPSKRYLSPQRVYLIMDFADGGELHRYMNDNKDKMEASLRINLIRDLFFGLWYLHQNDIIHGDVHTGNALIFKEGDDLVAKWSDFGLGFVGSNRQYQYNTASTARQRPQRHKFRSDINGLHTVIHETLRGRRLCRRETREEKERLNQCEEMADFMIRNVQSLQEVYQHYRHILEDELVFDEQHFS